MEQKKMQYGDAALVNCEIIIYFFTFYFYFLKENYLKV